MRKFFSVFLISIFVLSGLALAEQQYQNNGTNIGIANKTNLVGCTITRSGEIATINCQSQTGPVTVTGTEMVTGAATFNGGIAGINWAAIPQGFITGINWTGADILGQGLNWTDVRTFGTAHGGDHSGVNWQAFGV